MKERPANKTKRKNENRLQIKINEKTGYQQKRNETGARTTIFEKKWTTAYKQTKQE